MKLFAIALAALAGTAAFADRTFPVSCWTYMRFEEQTRPVEQVARDWKDLGITHPLMPVTCARTDKKAVLHMLDVCDRYGLHVLMHDERVYKPAVQRLLGAGKADEYRTSVRSAIDDWGAHPACAGFFIWDEPDSNEVAVVVQASRICKELAPDKIWYNNLLPWYDWIGPRLGNSDYGDYLEKVTTACGLPSMGYDFYEQQNALTGAEKGTDLYFNNLRNWMELVRRHPHFRYNVTQACASFYNYRVDSQDDYRWQISTAAAMGAKGLNWFYPDMSSKVQGCAGNMRDAPINEFGERTAAFAWMSHELRRFQRQYGSEFMRLSIEDAFMTGRARGGVKPFEKDADVVRIGAARPVLVSFFRDEAGVRYMAAVNLDRKASQHVTFMFAPDVRPMQRLFTREYRKMETNADPVAERDAGGRRPHSAGRYLAPGQLVLVKLAKESGK